MRPLAPFTYRLVLKHTDPLVHDHTVHGVHAMPGVTFLDIVCRLLNAEGVDPAHVELRNIFFAAPVVTTPEDDRVIEVSLEPRGDTASITGRSRRASGDAAARDEWVENFRCELHAAGAASIASFTSLASAALVRESVRTIDMDSVYAGARRVSILHGDYMRASGRIHTDGTWLLADLSLSAAALARAESDRFYVHPAYLDASTFVPFALDLPTLFQELAYIPIHIDSFRVLAPLGTRGWVHAPVAGTGSTSKDIFRGSYTIFDEDGRPSVIVGRLSVKQIRTSASIGAAVSSDPEPPASRVDARHVSVTAIDDTAANADDVQSALRVMVAAALGGNPEDVSTEVGFYEQGLDSTHLVRLVRDLEKALECSLYPTLLFEYSTIRELAEYLRPHANVHRLRHVRPPEPEPTGARELAPAPAQAARAGEASVERAADDAEPIALIGLAGRYPMARTIEEFWRNLREGRDCITEIPATRWEHQPYFDPNGRATGSVYSRWGGFIDDVEMFDPRLFNIPPKEAALRDPQERLFLQTVWETLEDAGYTRQSLARVDVGVFVAAMWGQYQLFAQGDVVPDSIPASIANRTSYCFNFRGPSIALDTMCSGSLTALHLACESLRRGECAVAIAGGVNLSVHPNKYVQLSQGRFLSSDGRCRSFGAGGDGYVPGEGVGAVLLKPLSAAVAAGDHVYGVIKGTAVNHGGRTSGYAVPNPAAQAEVIAAALARAGVSPETIDYIEAHGTGTSLGDPIEIAGLARVFANVGPGRCAIGSVKSNVGHLEAAAGIAGLTKVLLQFAHGELVPSLHAGSPNPAITFESTPFRVQQTLAPWAPVAGPAGNLPRRAAVSSFGAGGANAHVVLEEYVSPARLRSREAAHLIVLSTKTAPQLDQYATALLAWLQSRARDGLAPAVEDLAFTLQAGREAMTERLAFVARTVADVVRGLECFTTGREDGVRIHRGRARGHAADNTRIDTAGGAQDLERIAARWTAGELQPDWESSFAGAGGRRISLPTYPFARERCWVDIDVAAAASPSPSLVGGRPAARPALAASLDEQRSTVHLGSRDVFIKDHVVGDAAVAPAALFLEIARDASEAFVGPFGVSTLTLAQFIRPFEPRDGASALQVLASRQGDRVVCSMLATRPDGQAAVEHARVVATSARAVAGDPAMAIDLATIQQRAGERTEGARLYECFARAGLRYGPSLRSVAEVFSNASEALARLERPEASTAGEALPLDPSMVDGGLQTVAVLIAADGAAAAGSVPLLPVSIAAVHIRGPIGTMGYAYVRSRENAASGSRLFDIQITDETGRVAVSMERCEFARALIQPNAGVRGEALVSDDLPLMLRAEYVEAEGERETEPPRDGPLVVFASSRETRASWHAALGSDAGARQIVIVQPGHEFRETGPDEYEVAPDRLEDYTRLLAAIGQVPRAVVLAWSAAAEGAPLRDQVARSMYAALGVTQALGAGRLAQRVDVLAVWPRRGAASAAADAALPGFARTVRQEQPSLRWRTVEVDDATPSALAAAVRRELATASDAVDVQYVAGRRRVRRWMPLAAATTTAAAGTAASATVTAAARATAGARAAAGGGAALGAGPRRGGVYLVTGGAGALSLHCARHLVAGGGRVVLLGRRPWASVAAAVEALGAGDAVTYVAGDVQKTEDVRQAVVFARARYGGLTGVLHAAGVTRDGLARHKPAADVAAVLASKVEGTIALDEATRDEALAWFVLFASTSGVLGNVGQSDYAYANAFQWAYAAEREALRARGARQGRTLTIAWPLWADGGMRVDDATKKLLRDTTGMGELSTAKGLAALDRALAGSDAQVMVIDGDRDRLRTWLDLTPPVSTAPPVDGRLTADRLTADRLTADLCDIVCDLLKVKRDAIDVDETFDGYGFDSIGLTDLANRINDRFGTQVTPPLFFERPTITRLAQYLHDIVDAAVIASGGTTIGTTIHATIDATSGTPIDTTSVTAVGTPLGTDLRALAERPNRRSLEHDAGSGPIAIIGMSAVMPGAEDLDQFWTALVEGRDLVGEVPPDRWDWRSVYGSADDPGNRTAVKWGGFMKDVAGFDAAFFGISPREAALMDPQQRIWLQVVWRAIEDAGYRASTLSGTATGLFVGVSAFDYAELLRDSGIALEAYTSTGLAHALLPNRISYLLNFHGPSETVDTACSSSLVAVHRAVEALRSGTCTLAIAGGVNVMLTPTPHIAFSKAGLLSPDGRCRAFDAAANGYVRGEGAGAVVLKPLSRALADGDRIDAVIRGTAVNHGGHANSLTAPNPTAQSALLVDAYTRAGIDPSTVTCIEAHGTGTKLGDPVEINALKDAFARLYARAGRVHPDRPHCWLGSVKTNIGHLEAAAGIAGLIKIILAMRHRMVPASLHCGTVNPYIQLEGSPFQIVRETQPWKQLDDAGRPVPRRAGVSSFGFGGANAHVVIEEGVQGEASAMGADGPSLIVLSAKDHDALRESAANLAAFVERRGAAGTAAGTAASAAAASLRDVAYTLAVGREVWPERIAVIAAHPAALADALRGYLDGRDMPGLFSRNGCTASTSRAGDAVLRTAIDTWDLGVLAEAWTHGADVDWRPLYRGGAARVSLPTYPFKKERHWIDTYEANLRATADAVDPIEPLPPPPPPDAIADSREVTLDVIDDAIALITLRDHANTNMLSAPLVDGLASRLAQVRRMPGIKAVVVTGADRVFCMGATRETLLDIAEGRARCSDFPIVYEGFLSCDVPVIAAMQGHAAGGGLVLGLYADIVVMASEMTYSANFTTLGFTPGMGATLILERKLGANLATEMMFTARPYEGEELQRRGASIVVRPAADVLPAALATARLLAEKPIETLRVLKQSVAGKLLAALPAVVADEVVMHDRTATQPGVRARVERYFERTATPPSSPLPSSLLPSLPAPSLPLASSPPVDTTATFAGGAPKLKLRPTTPLSTVSADAARPARPAPLGPAPLAPPAKLAPSTPLAAPAPAARSSAPASAVDETEVARRITAIARRILHVREIDPDVSLRDIGLDSIGAVEVARDISRTFDLHLDAIALYDHPSIARLTEFTRSKLAERGPRPTPASEPTSPAAIKSASERPQEHAQPVAVASPGLPADIARATGIAVIGMSGRFPGARSVDEFWIRLREGRDEVREAPADRSDLLSRFDPDPKAPNKSYSKWGGFLDGIDDFDPQFFNILPSEAELIDPQHRLFLEECWKALEDAGYAPDSLGETACGVFAGVSAGDHARRLELAGRDIDGRMLLGCIPSALPARVSYALNLRGPSVAIDTACSSSLVAVHQACQSLVSGESDLALAGGVCVMTTAEMHVMTSKAGMLSPRGRCRPFDDGADGIVLSEAVAVVVLKPVSAALRDGDRIYGVIAASAINNDGRSNGLSAPTMEAQLELERSVYRAARLTAEEIGYVEAHGTGTRLGDPIEVAALTAAFRDTTERRQFCAIGSVKSNIGHALSAAGIAGLIKVLLCLRHKALVPSIHFDRANQHLRLEETPFYVPVATVPWTCPSGRRVAALSSFGMTGTNCHMVIEEWIGDPAAASLPGLQPQLVVLSARTDKSLRENAARLAQFLRERSAVGADDVDDPPRLDEIAYTLLFGRAAMDERLAIVADDLSDLVGKLTAFCEGAAVSGVFSGRAPRLKLASGGHAVDDEENVDLTTLAAAWIRGEVDPRRVLFRDARPKRISLPTYVFAKMRCAVEGRYEHTITFTGREPFIADHVMLGRATVPAVCCLEVARAAALRAGVAPAARMTQVVWLRPLIVADGGQTAHVSLVPMQDAAAFEMFTRDERGDRVVHVRGQIDGSATVAPLDRIDVASFVRQASRHTDAREFYDAFAPSGCNYGPSLRVLHLVAEDGGAALAAIEPPAAKRGDDELVLDPATLDGMFQVTIALLRDGSRDAARAYLPFSMEALELVGSCTRACYVHAVRVDRRDSARGAESSAVFDLQLLDESGTPLVRVRRLVLRPVPRDAAAPSALTPEHALAMLERLRKGEIDVAQAERAWVGIV